ncbi:MAG: serine/threonine protein kinase, partial [Candidatus Chisholmbacteria bacterium]|nr:serine/threonine protein kinase [Candidatus Chisholmbacteria bacterium]
DVGELGISEELDDRIRKDFIGGDRRQLEGRTFDLGEGWQIRWLPSEGNTRTFLLTNETKGVAAVVKPYKGVGFVVDVERLEVGNWVGLSEAAKNSGFVNPITHVSGRNGYFLAPYIVGYEGENFLLKVDPVETAKKAADLLIGASRLGVDFTKEVVMNKGHNVFYVTGGDKTGSVVLFDHESYEQTSGVAAEDLMRRQLEKEVEDLYGRLVYFEQSVAGMELVRRQVRLVYELLNQVRQRVGLTEMNLPVVAEEKLELKYSIRPIPGSFNEFIDDIVAQVRAAEKLVVEERAFRPKLVSDEAMTTEEFINGLLGMKVAPLAVPVGEVEEQPTVVGAGGRIITGLRDQVRQAWLGFELAMAQLDVLPDRVQWAAAIGLSRSRLLQQMSQDLSREELKALLEVRSLAGLGGWLTGLEGEVKRDKAMVIVAQIKSSDVGDTLPVLNEYTEAIIKAWEAARQGNLAEMLAAQGRAMEQVRVLKSQLDDAEVGRVLARTHPVTVRMSQIFDAVKARHPVVDSDDAVKAVATDVEAEMGRVVVPLGEPVVIPAIDVGVFPETDRQSGQLLLEIITGFEAKRPLVDQFVDHAWQRVAFEERLKAEFNASYPEYVDSQGKTRAVGTEVRSLITSRTSQLSRNSLSGFYSALGLFRGSAVIDQQWLEGVIKYYQQNIIGEVYDSKSIAEKLEVVRQVRQYMREALGQLVEYEKKKKSEPPAPARRVLEEPVRPLIKWQAVFPQFLANGLVALGNKALEVVAEADLTPNAIQFRAAAGLARARVLAILPASVERQVFETRIITNLTDVYEAVLAIEDIDLRDQAFTVLGGISSRDIQQEVERMRRLQEGLEARLPKVVPEVVLRRPVVQELELGESLTEADTEFVERVKGSDLFRDWDIEVLRLLGRGAEGRVYLVRRRAREVDEPEWYAAKVYTGEFGPRREGGNIPNLRFAEHRGEFASPEEVNYTVNSYGYDSDEGILMMELYLLPGRPLPDLIQAMGIGDRVSMSLPLQLVHYHYLVRQDDWANIDSKTENYWVDEKGVLKVSDVGLFSRVKPEDLSNYKAHHINQLNHLIQFLGLTVNKQAYELLTDLLVLNQAQLPFSELPKAVRYDIGQLVSSEAFRELPVGVRYLTLQILNLFKVPEGGDPYSLIAYKERMLDVLALAYEQGVPAEQIPVGLRGVDKQTLLDRTTKFSLARVVDFPAERELTTEEARVAYKEFVKLFSEAVVSWRHFAVSDEGMLGLLYGGSLISRVSKDEVEALGVNSIDDLKLLLERIDLADYGLEEKLYREAVVKRWIMLRLFLYRDIVIPKIKAQKQLDLEIKLRSGEISEDDYEYEREHLFIVREDFSQESREAIERTGMIFEEVRKELLSRDFNEALVRQRLGEIHLIITGLLSAEEAGVLGSRDIEVERVIRLIKGYGKTPPTEPPLPPTPPVPPAGGVPVGEPVGGVAPIVLVPPECVTG